MVAMVIFLHSFLIYFFLETQVDTKPGASKYLDTVFHTEEYSGVRVRFGGFLFVCFVLFFLQPPLRAVAPVFCSQDAIPVTYLIPVNFMS